MSGRTWSLIVLAGLLLLPALAQETPPGQAQPPRPRGEPGQGRERMLNNIKEQSGATDEQWKTLAPKVEKVMALQRELRGSMGGRGGDAATPPESKLAQAQRDLRAALENKETPAAEITQKLTAYREAREKAREELKVLQKDLKDGTTPRQEAVFVLNGLLD